jgi:hypothetical protein
MQLGRLVRRVGRFEVAAIVAVAIGISACSGQGDSLVEPPTIPGDPPLNPAFKAAAFIVDVDTRGKRIKITAPARGVSAAPSAEGGLGGPSLSLVGGDVVELTASGYDAPLPGAPCQGTTISQANKICVTFDISVRNVLSGVELIGPTVFPAAPAGTTGPLLFPFEQLVTTTSGGVSTGGQGNDIIVELPNRGMVEANGIWDGAPHNFFNDALCAASDNDCFRWEEYPSPIAGGFTVGPRRVGFFIDPTVGNFRSRMLVAADLRNSGGGGPTTGTILGQLTTTVSGVTISGTVSINPGSFSGPVTGGAFSVAGVTSGTKTVTFTLSNGCTAGPLTGVVLNPGATLDLGNIATTGCTPPAGGNVRGLINSSLGGPLSGVTVTLTPTSGAGGSDVTDAGATFNYDIAVALGASGTAAITAVPSGCTLPTTPGLGSYNITSSGQIVTLSPVTVTCAPPANAINGTWSQTATSATLELRVNIVQPGINVGTFEGNINVSNSRLFYDVAPAGFAAATGTNLSNVFAGSPPQTGPFAFGAFTTTAGGLTGDVGVIRITYRIAAGAPTTVAGCAPTDASCPLLPASALVALNIAFGDILPTFDLDPSPSVARYNITIPALNIP